MVTLSENNNSSECSTTTPQIGTDREHFGSNIVSSTQNEREFAGSNPANASGSTIAAGSAVAAAAAAAATAAAAGVHSGHWDLTNPEIGYELASSGKQNFIINMNKHVECEFFAIFPVKVTKTNLTTNCDHF